MSRCQALLLSVSYDHCLEGLKTFLPYDDVLNYFKTTKGEKAKKILAFFRLWCVVELAAACAFDLPVVVKAGRAKLCTTTTDEDGKIRQKSTEKEDDKEYVYAVEREMDDVLINLKNAVDINILLNRVKLEEKNELKKKNYFF